jgi:hypothetical protein
MPDKPQPHPGTCDATLTGGTRHRTTLGPCTLGRGHDAHRDANGDAWYTPSAALSPAPAIRQRIADTLRAAAHRCGETCSMDERACHLAHPIQEAASGPAGITDVYGPIDDIARVVAEAVQPPVDKRRVQLARALGLPEDSEWLELLVIVVKNRQAADRVREDEARTGGPGAPIEGMGNASYPREGEK